MARSDYVNRVKSILYGQGLGEKPSIRRVAATSNVSVSGSVVTFDLLAGEGSNVKAGHTLAFVSPNDTAQAYTFYVLSMSTDQVTALNGYHGAPNIANASADMDAGVLEQNPLRTEFEIHKAVDTVFESWLYPHVYYLETGSFTPNLQHGQIALDADVKDIDRAWQVIGGEAHAVPFNLFRNVHATVAANNVLGVFDPIDASTVYFTFRRKLVLGDETGASADPSPEALINLVSIGGAALVLDWSASETQLERTKKDSQNRTRDVAATLMRQFFTLRENFGREDAEDFTEILVQRSF